jgi:serine/threonine protein kinase
MIPVIPRYELQGELGRGGMGVVYQARRKDTGQVVALKLMLRGRGAGIEELARFRVEAEALACLDHPNISRVIEVGVVQGCPFFVTEYAAHGTIRDHAGRAGKSVEWCVDAVRQVALGLHHAHSRAMIHRDVKPANILIMEDETPKISDFGLVKFRAPVHELAAASRAPHVAESFFDFDQLLNQSAREIAAPDLPGQEGRARLVKGLREACLERTGLPEQSIDLATIEWFLETVVRESRCEPTGENALSPLPVLDDLTQPGAILGSPQFMAPEQVASDQAAIGPRTDVYGLGATLYWLLTGEPVVTGRNLPDLLQRIQTEWPRPIQELNAGVPEAVDCVVWKAIQKDPPRRYESCQALADELQCCLDGKKPHALQSREKFRQQLAAEQVSNKAAGDLFLKAFPPRAD